MDIKNHVMAAWKLGLDHFTSLLISTLLLAAVGVISLGILVPVTFSGYVWSILQLIENGREPRAQDIFSQMRLFLPLFFFSLIIFIITAIGFTLFILPGILFTLIVGYTCIYMIPLMVDRQFGLIDAVKKSTAVVTSAPFADHLVVFIVFYFLTTVGSSSFVGFLVLQPFATLFLLSVYKEAI